MLRLLKATLGSLCLITAGATLGACVGDAGGPPTAHAQAATDIAPIDTDGDGVPDGLDTDCDGTVDVPL